MGIVIFYFSVVIIFLTVWILGSIFDNRKYPIIKFKDFLTYYARNPNIWVLYYRGVYQRNIQEEYRFSGLDRIKFARWLRRHNAATRAEENDEALEKIRRAYKEDERF